MNRQNQIHTLRRNNLSEQSLKVIQFNCNSLSNKLSEFKLYLYSSKPDIVCLCETMIKRSEPKFIGYSSCWKHREGEKGGLGILIRHDLYFREVQFDGPNGGNLEIQMIEIGSDLGTIRIANVYNPHKNILLQEFNHYIHLLGEKFIITGDFNAHSPLWDSRERYNQTGRNLESILENLNIGILNDLNTPTYIDNRTGTTSCLDLCLASQTLANVGEQQRGRDLGSDHFPMEFSFGLYVRKSDLKKVQHWKLKKVNWKAWQLI